MLNDGITSPVVSDSTLPDVCVALPVVSQSSMEADAFVKSTRPYKALMDQLSAMQGEAERLRSSIRDLQVCTNPL